MGLANAALVLVLGAGLLAPSSRPPDHTGYVVRYGAGVTSRVARNRGIAWQPHMAAYTYARDSDMGQLHLHIKGPAGEATFLVVDLPRSRDKPGLIRRGVVGEVDYQSGRGICGEHWSGRARDCPVKVWVER